MLPLYAVMIYECKIERRVPEWGHPDASSPYENLGSKMCYFCCAFKNWKLLRCWMFVVFYL